MRPETEAGQRRMESIGGLSKGSELYERKRLSLAMRPKLPPLTPEQKRIKELETRCNWLTAALLEARGNRAEDVFALVKPWLNGDADKRGTNENGVIAFLHGEMEIGSMCRTFMACNCICAQSDALELAGMIPAIAEKFAASGEALCTGKNEEKATVEHLTSATLKAWNLLDHLGILMQSWPFRKRMPVEKSVAALRMLLQRILYAGSREDHVALADILEYEITEALDELKSALESVAQLSPIGALE